MNRFIEYIALRIEIGRALRSSVAFVTPLLVCHALGRTADGVFIAIAAQTIALPDLRGSYGMRLGILFTMTLAVAGASMLGVWTGGNVIAATLAMGFLALLGGGWRHLSADYGPPLSVSSALLFLLGTAQPGSWAAGWHLAGLIMLGGAGAALLHIVFWPFLPQHPLRSAVAESWVAASDLAASMRAGLITGREASGEATVGRERELRATLDRTFVILGAAERRQPSSFITHLEEMRRQVVHFAMRVTAFHASLESLLVRPDFARNIPTIDSVFKALGDAARSVAITLISHRRENFDVTEVRLRRCQHLMLVLEGQLTKGEADLSTAQTRATLGQIAQIFAPLRKALGETVDHGDARAIFPAKLPELSGRSVYSLAAWINPASELDPVLIRYALRMAVLTMGAVAIYKGFAIPRGYWIAFTIMVVLQPDYGSTRQRAAERIGGTLAGSLLGSAFVWIKMPLLLLDSCAGLMSFCFAFFLKRNYGVAVFFVTLMLVLVTETTGPIHLDLPLSRLLLNVAGGAVALVSAVVFWPSWEGEKFTVLLAAAVRANRAYLHAIASVLSTEDGEPLDLLMFKRRAENADRFVSASLQRMLGEPGGRSETAERAASLTTYNQRITRACTAIVVHWQGDPALREDGLSRAASEIGDELELLAQIVEREGTGFDGSDLTRRIETLESSLATIPSLSHSGTSSLSFVDLMEMQLAKSVAEIRAMLLVLDGANPLAKKSG